MEYLMNYGREFVNNEVTNFCNKKNINIIRGRPYNPKNQGVVEPIHSTIRKDLLAYYIEYPSDFNISISSNKFMKKYNNLVHKSTQHTPYEIFYSNSADLFNEVKNNCIKYFENNRKLGYNFVVGENCLLVNNFIKVNQKINFVIIIWLKIK